MKKVVGTKVRRLDAYEKVTGKPIYGDDINDTLRIIISDVEMPRMDGFHFAEKVKSDTRFENIPILFNSSFSDSFSEERGRNAGGAGYLVKFDTSMFYDEIARVIRVYVK